MHHPPAQTVMQRASDYLRWIGGLPSAYGRCVDLAVLHRLIETYPAQARILLRERDQRESLRIEPEQ